MCEPFAIFPRRLLRAGLSRGEMPVLVCLLSYKGDANEAWPSQTTIAADTGMSVRHVNRTIKSLIQKGIIKCETQAGVRTVYTFPCLDNPPEQPAPEPVVAKNATAAEPAPVAKPAPAPKPEPAPEPVPVATPEPAHAQPTADSPSHVAAPVQQPDVAPAPVATPVPAPEPAAKPQPEPQPAPAPVSVAHMPALEPAPPAPRRNIVSARVARLPDVDEAVRREVEARPIIRTPKPAGVDDALWEKCQRLQALCAENTARSREQKAAAQRFEDGVTAATEQVAKQVAAQDIAAARQRAAQDAAAAKPEQQAAQDAAPPAPAMPATDQKPDEQPAAEKTTDGQNADAARDAAVRDGCYPAGGKTNSPEPVAPDTAATAPIVLPAPIVVQEPQPPAATPQQGELLPAPAKRSRSVKTVAVQGELLPEEGGTRGRCLPKNWYLPREWGVWAMEELGFTEDEVRYQAKKFRDHWISTTRNPAKKDWFATWRNWMRGENEKKQRHNNRPPQKSKTMQIIESFAKKYNGDFGIPF